MNIEEIKVNFNKSKNENVKIDIWYNPKKINSENILNKMFKLKNNIICYEENLKNKITGIVKILDDSKDNDFLIKDREYNKLSLSIDFIYDESKLDFTLYTMGLEDRITNNNFYELNGVDKISIKGNNCSGTVQNCYYC